MNGYGLMNAKQREEYEAGTLHHYQGDAPAKPHMCWAKRHGQDLHCRANGNRRNGRCRMHAGHSLPPGPDHPSYKNGTGCRYPSLAGNGDLAAHYKAAVRDKDLLALREEVALVQALLTRHVQRLAAGDGAASAAKLAAAWSAFKAANSRKDTASMTVAGHEMDRLVAGLTDEEEQERRVVELAQEKKTLVKAELDRMAELRQVATLPHVLMLLSNLWVAVLSEIIDGRPAIEARRAIAAKFAVLVGKNSPLVTVVPDCVVGGKNESEVCDVGGQASE